MKGSKKQWCEVSLKQVRDWFNFWEPSQTDEIINQAWAEYNQRLHDRAQSEGLGRLAELEMQGRWLRAQSDALVRQAKGLGGL